MGPLISAVPVQKSCKCVFFDDINTHMLLFLTKIPDIYDWNIRYRAYIYDVQGALRGKSISIRVTFNFL